MNASCFSDRLKKEPIDPSMCHLHTARIHIVFLLQGKQAHTPNHIDKQCTKPKSACYSQVSVTIYINLMFIRYELGAEVNEHTEAPSNILGSQPVGSFATM